MNLPSFTNYGKFSSDNYGVHTLMFSTPKADVYFSYKTPVAFIANGKRVVSENIWGTNTGKHLNWIDGGNKKARIKRDEFENDLAKIFKE
jgi:hypothetical protein